jgi:hypothetical protein
MFLQISAPDIVWRLKDHQTFDSSQKLSIDNYQKLGFLKNIDEKIFFNPGGGTFGI